MQKNKKVVSIVSGGLDSVCMAYGFHANGYEQIILSFDYGQRHKKELHYAEILSKKINAKFYSIDLSVIKPLLKGSSLTDNISVPDGHYASENMKITVVPNRNAIMLSIAYATAISNDYGNVAIAVHSGDHFIYPDCRPDFINSFQRMENYSNAGNENVSLLSPFMHFSKIDIVSYGEKYKVPFSETWSCYKGEEKHCGTCGTCIERKEAFELADVLDPTIYYK